MDMRAGRGSTLQTLVAGALVLVFAIPILVAASAAFRPQHEIFRYGVELGFHSFFPADPTLGSLGEILGRGTFVRQLLNTLVLGVSMATLAVAVAVLAAYPLARMDVRGKDALFLLLIGGVFLPFEVVVLPLFLVVRDLGLVDTFWALLLPWILSPFAVFLIRQAMAEVPRELEEAVLVDGGGLRHILRHAMLPNIRPAMATAWLLSFMAAFNAYLWPVVAVQDQSKQLVQVGIASLITPHDPRFDLVFAASLVAVMIPTILILATQRIFIRGVASVGIK